MESFDVVIIGGGPTGLSCAIELKKLGLNGLVIEKGCVVNSLFHYPVNMVFFTTAERLEIGDIPLVSEREKPSRLEALKYYRLVTQHFGLAVRQYEEVLEVRGSDGKFQVQTRDRNGVGHSHEAKKVVVATGYYDIPNLLGILGEKLPKVSHYYREAHPYYNTDIAVIGGRNSAVEAALDLFRNGARVTLIHRGAGLSDRIKYWVRPDIENRIKDGEIRAFFNTRVTEIRQDAIVVAPAQQNDGSESQTLRNDFVLALTGYQPDAVFLRRLGIKLEPNRLRPQCDPQTLESNVPGIYAAGVILAGLDTNEIFIENGRFHGKQVAEAIAAKLHDVPAGKM